MPYTVCWENLPMYLHVRVTPGILEMTCCCHSDCYTFGTVDQSNCGCNCEIIPMGLVYLETKIGKKLTKFKMFKSYKVVSKNIVGKSAQANATRLKESMGNVIRNHYGVLVVVMIVTCDDSGNTSDVCLQ